MTVLDTASGPCSPARRPAPGTTVPAGDLAGADERHLRSLRASLVEEALRLSRWQRLVRARLDLATDRLSPAEALGGAAGPGPASPAHPHPAAEGVPAGPADLVALVRGRVGGTTDAADDLRAVVTTHRALRARALVLAERLAGVDAALAARTAGRRCCPRG